MWKCWFRLGLVDISVSWLRPMSTVHTDNLKWQKPMWGISFSIERWILICDMMRQLKQPVWKLSFIVWLLVKKKQLINKFQSFSLWPLPHMWTEVTSCKQCVLKPWLLCFYYCMQWNGSFMFESVGFLLDLLNKCFIFFSNRDPLWLFSFFS